MTLEEKVRKLIGDFGPQLYLTEYEARIEEELDHMSVRELLHYISLALDDKDE